MMRTVVGMTLALLLGVGVAWAGDISGKVQTIDSAERAIVLDNGSKLWVAEGVPMDSLKEGDSVKASYEDRDGKMVVTSIEVSE